MDNAQPQPASERRVWSADEDVKIVALSGHTMVVDPLDQTHDLSCLQFSMTYPFQQHRDKDRQPIWGHLAIRRVLYEG